MLTNKNELQIYRGETFTIDKIFQNKDGSPYIVSSELTNPYWLLSISNTTYYQENRTVKNYWLPVNVPRFRSTLPVALTDIKTSSTGSAPVYTSFDDNITFPIVGYYNSHAVSFDEKDCVFYVEVNGVKTYKYWDNGWKDYECRIIKTFTQDDTSDLYAQNYLFSISLVSGMTTEDYVENLAIDYELAVEGFSTEQLYEILTKQVELKFPKNFSITQPIGYIDTSYPILEPTRMKVSNVLRGGITW